MQKTDKLFAGLVVLSLIAFWVIIAPAGVTSRISEAAPTTLAPDPAPTTVQNKRRLPLAAPADRAQRPQEPYISKEQLARLKRRNTDTPPNARELMLQRIQEGGAQRPAPGTADRRDLQNLHDAPNFEQVY